MAPAGQVVLELRLPRGSGAPRAARVAMADRFGDHVRCADLLLCVSEIVTNAVLHARSDVHLVVRRLDGVLRVEVADGDPTLPTPQDPPPSVPTGRGLRLLAALSERWGVDGRTDGKTVWFEVDHG